MLLPDLLVASLIMLQSARVSAKCRNTANCLCLNNSDYYEYQCAGDESSVVIQAKPTSIRIDCTDVKNIDGLLPEEEFENVTRLDVRFCPLPLNGIKYFSDRFKLKIDTLSLEYCYFNNTLFKNDFKDLYDLTKLRLRRNDLINIEDGFFTSFPKLKSLELDRNNLLLKEDTFKGLKNLKFLSLSDNKLTHIPEGLFDDLISLEKLELWRNDIKSVRNTAFKNLANLTTLELSYNKINVIDEGAFLPLRNLANISLKFNELTNVSRKLFKNTRLETVDLKNNLNLKLDAYLFANQSRLKIVHLGSLNLSEVEDLFENSWNVESINLENNNLDRVPIELLQNQPNLKVLNLSRNKIRSLDDAIFQSLGQLKKLHLQNNFLKEINDNLLKPLINVEEIDLSHNEIGKVHLEAFFKNRKLKRLSMKNNKWAYEDDQLFAFSPFNKCTDLEILDLSYNQIVDIPEDLLLHSSIRSIDLSNNRINSLRINALWKFTKEELKINLDSNNITHLNFFGAEEAAYHQPLDAYHYFGSSTVVSIYDNPISCDCFSYDFVRYINDQMYPGVKTAINVIYNNVTCASPELFRGVPLQNVVVDMLSCPLEDVVKHQCTSEEKCRCGWRPFDKTLVVDCSGLHMKVAPEIYLPDDLQYNQTEIHLEENLLQLGPRSSGYRNATSLFLNHNQIGNISWMPPNLQVMTLHDNRLKSLDYEMLRRMNGSSLRKLSLHNNPWECNCSISNLTKYVRHSLQMIVNPNITCHNSNRLLINLNEKDLCPNKTVLALVSFTILVSLLLIATTLTTLYYKFENEIKVWLYARNACLWLVKEEELDKDKPYDVFISYSHKDEELVIEHLISVLENGPEPYKLCVHFRDWVPGEYIGAQVAASVRDSRRTLVVLTSHFVESVWGKMEFRTAHQEAMREGRARVIVVLFDDVEVEKLDEELRAYLKTNTYVRWDDPWFWDKMRYALPHSKGRKNQKHANVMKYIDDKFVPSKMAADKIMDVDRITSDLVLTKVA